MRDVYKKVASLNVENSNPTPWQVADAFEQIVETALPFGAEYLDSASDLELSSMNYFLSYARELTKQRPELYYVTSNFLNDLTRVKREKIPVDHFPDSFFTYITFGTKNNIRNLEDTPADGVFIKIRTSTQKRISIEFGFVFPDKKSANESIEKVIPSCYLYQIQAKHGTSLDQAIDQGTNPIELFAKMDKEPISKKVAISRDSIKQVTTQVLNILLFLKIEDSEIIKLRPINGLSNKKRKDISKSQKGYENPSTLPMTLINYSFHSHQKVFSKEQTVVAGHHRMVPCGPGKSRLKIVWIQEHLRTFKNSKDNVDVEK